MDVRVPSKAPDCLLKPAGIHNRHTHGPIDLEMEGWEPITGSSLRDIFPHQSIFSTSNPMFPLTQGSHLIEHC